MEVWDGKALLAVAARQLCRSIADRMIDAIVDNKQRCFKSDIVPNSSQWDIDVRGRRDDELNHYTFDSLGGAPGLGIFSPHKKCHTYSVLVLRMSIYLRTSFFQTV